MPSREDLRLEEMKFVRCASCGEYLSSMVPKGVTGEFYHPECAGKESRMPNLIEGLLEQSNRVRDIIKIYDDTPNGGTAALMMRNSIARAEKAIETGDTIEMMLCFTDLEEYKV